LAFQFTLFICFAVRTILFLKLIIYLFLYYISSKKFSFLLLNVKKYSVGYRQHYLVLSAPLSPEYFVLLIKYNKNT